MIEEKNAVIKVARITNEDHGILSIWLDLDYGSGGQGFGGYVLYNPSHKEDITGSFIWRILEITGVNEWEKLKGRPIRVRAEHDKVHAIGHYLKDIWFNPSEELK